MWTWAFGLKCDSYGEPEPFKGTDGEPEPHGTDIEPEPKFFPAPGRSSASGITPEMKFWNKQNEARLKGTWAPSAGIPKCELRYTVKKLVSPIKEIIFCSSEWESLQDKDTGQWLTHDQDNSPGLLAPFDFLFGGF